MRQMRPKAESGDLERGYLDMWRSAKCARVRSNVGCERLVSYRGGDEKSVSGRRYVRVDGSPGQSSGVAGLPKDVCRDVCAWIVWTWSEGGDESFVQSRI